jgi:hypothetical protein
VKYLEQTGKTNQVIKIAGENKEYVSELEYVKYLGVPLGSKRIC